MNTTKLISELDKQIARLREARNLLAEEAGMSARKGGLGRGKAAPRKRVLTTEARAKMAAAQKRRWAAYRKAQ